MSIRLVASVGVAVLVACGSTPPPTQVVTPPPTVDAAVPTVDAAPVSDAPTLRLPRTFVPTKYAVQMVLDPAATGFSAEIHITGSLVAATDVLWLNSRELVIKTATATHGSETVALEARQVGDEFLRLSSAAPLVPGEWTLNLAYTATYEGVSRVGIFKVEQDKTPYLFTQFESIYARRAFPCFDEPDVKVPWQLTLDVPEKLVAVSNTNATSDKKLGNGLRRVEFAETKPLPSYLLALGVGPFDIVDAGRTKSGTPVRVIALAQRGNEAAYAAQTAAKLLDACETWFGIPYPFGKLDVIAVRSTQFGAMENAGLVTFAEGLILFDAKASRQAKHWWIRVAAHEFAHQWFGNLVTTAWWDDIWLNEGFANWIETKIAAAVDPASHDLDSVLDMRNSALASDALVTARKIRQPIVTNDDVINAFDGITYDKGASVLAMFENFVGPAAFQTGVRTYLKAHAFGSATSADFVGTIAKSAGKPELARALDSFLDQAGAPELALEVACSGAASVTVTQRRYLPPGAATPTASTPWTIPVCLAYEANGKRAQTCALVTQPTQTISLPTKKCPRWVMSNAAGRGYYRTTYTTPQLTSLRDEAWPLLTWLERRALWFDARQQVETGKAPLAYGLSLIAPMMAGNDQFTVPEAVGFAGSFTPWVPDALRPKYEYWLQRTFGPAARALGYTEKPNERLDDETIRDSLVQVVAWTARDPELVAQAVVLAEKWRELPQSLRGIVLPVAVDAKPEVFEAIASAVLAEPDSVKRGELYAALASVRDRKRQTRALDFMRHPKADPNETMWMLLAGSTEAAKLTARDYFKQHEKEILGRLPADGPFLAHFSRVYTQMCRGDERDQVAGYVKGRFTKFPGGERIVAQAIERLDQCIAQRALVGPDLEAWLGGIRIIAEPGDKPEAKIKNKRDKARKARHQ